MPKIIYIFAKNVAKKFVKYLGFSQSCHDFTHLQWCKRALVMGVTRVFQCAHERWMMLHPSAELLPSRFRSDVWAIELCQLSTAILFYSEIHCLYKSAQRYNQLTANYHNFPSIIARNRIHSYLPTHGCVSLHRWETPAKH